MASGFQLDSNQLTPGLYRVQIDTSNATNYPVCSGSAVATNQGAVNPYDWDAGSVYTGGLPTSAYYAQALAQGNLRFQRIVESLAAISDCKLLDPTVVSGGTSGNYQPTSVSFTVAFDRDAFVLPEYNKMQLAANSANTTYLGLDGSTVINTTALAVKDIVAGAISMTAAYGATAITNYYRQYRQYNIAQNGDSSVNVYITQPNTGATIFGTVTVSQVALTGLTY